MASVCVAYCTEPVVGVGRNLLGSAVLNPPKTVKVKTIAFVMCYDSAATVNATLMIT